MYYLTIAGSVKGLVILHFRIIQLRINCIKESVFDRFTYYIPYSLLLMKLALYVAASVRSIDAVKLKLSLQFV